MKLIGGTKSKITKDENGTEVVLVHFDIVYNDY